MLLRTLRCLFIISLVVFLDQASKYWAFHTLKGMPRVSIFSFLNLTYVTNPGVSFGFFKMDSETGALFLAVIASVIAGIFLKYAWDAKSRFVSLGFLLIVGGALGNIIDRVRLGWVIDFIDFHWLGWHFPAFNIGDAAITLGAMIILGAELLNLIKKH